jgi:pimeloyl-ACP methyl ester carboxylesterase
MIHGSRDAPNGTILLLHGFTDNANSFFFLAPKLAREGFCCVAIEFTGHGRSDHSNTQTSHFSYVYDVVDVADTLQLQQFHLIGHSMVNFFFEL